MPRGVPHPPAVRAAVVADIAAGEPVSVVAKRHGVSKTRAIEWSHQLQPVEPDNARTRERMAELVYDTLGDILNALRVQLQAVTREEWLAQQTAGDLAALMGTELDRAVRLLAGFRPAENPALGPGESDQSDQS